MRLSREKELYNRIEGAGDEGEIDVPSEAGESRNSGDAQAGASRAAPMMPSVAEFIGPTPFPEGSLAGKRPRAGRRGGV